MMWNHLELWTKSKLYMSRALVEGPDNELYAFWASLSLELLAKAVLAKIHPVLVADPADGRSILYACGINTGLSQPKRPKSIPAHTLFARCILCCKNFTSEDEAFCLTLAERRNSELHSAELGFAGYSSSLWLARYFTVATKLLKQFGKPLDEFLGSSAQATAARRMIKGEEASRKAAVLKRVASAKKSYAKLSSLVRIRRIAESKVTLAQLAADANKLDKCPACLNDCCILGSRITTGDPRLDGDEILIRASYLPESMKCLVCLLNLKGHQELHIVSKGGQYSVDEVYDAAEYYAPEYEPEMEYGND